MTLGEHLEDLRKRLIYAVVGLAVTMTVSMIWGKGILDLLQYPYNVVMRESKDQSHLTVLSSTAGFAVFFKVALIAGLIVAAPWIFYQFWMFVSAGLYPREKRHVRYAVPFSVALFVSGAAFFLFVTAVPMLRFLYQFNNWLGLTQMWTLDEYIQFMTKSMLLFGLAFQTPLVVLFLAKMGLVSVKTLNKYRRHMMVGILILSGFLTASPSPLDQIALAVPLYLLFEMGVVLAYFSTRKKSLEGNE
jgi:sec-independent protein translocase protein TatC